MRFFFSADEGLPKKTRVEASDSSEEEATSSLRGSNALRSGDRLRSGELRERKGEEVKGELLERGDARRALLSLSFSEAPTSSVLAEVDG